MAHRRKRTKKNPSPGLLLALIAVVILVVVLVVVLASGGTKKHPPASTLPTTAAPTPTDAAPSSATPTAAAAPIVLTGNGPGTPSFTAAGGLTVLTARHDGSDDFSVQITNSSGQRVATPIDGVGAYAGTVSEALDAGNYTLNVGASSPWTLTVTQPRNQQAFHLPYAFGNGVGDALIGPFRADGAYQIMATNRGQANFVVTVLTTTGQQDVAMNEVGNYSGSVTETGVTPGNYYLQVNSDGSWSINVSSA